MKILEDSIKQLQQIIDNLIQEKNHLSIVGRALTPQEIQLIEKIERTLPILQKAMAELQN